MAPNVCSCRHVCKTAYRRHCEPHQEQKCHVEQKRHCEDKRKRECHTEYRTTYETYYEKECVYYKCRKVEKKRPKKEPYQECEYKTYQVVSPSGRCLCMDGHVKMVFFSS